MLLIRLRLRRLESKQRAQNGGPSSKGWNLLSLSLFRDAGRRTRWRRSTRKAIENRSHFLDARLRFSGDGGLDVEVLGRVVDASVSVFVSKSWISRGRRMSHSWSVGPWVVVGIGGIQNIGITDSLGYGTFSIERRQSFDTSILTRYTEKKKHRISTLA